MKTFRQFREQLDEGFPVPFKGHHLAHVMRHAAHGLGKKVAAGATALTMAAGCATGEVRHGGYYWTPKQNDTMAACKGITWKQNAHADNICASPNSFKTAGGPRKVYACAIGGPDDQGKCLVVSKHSEDEAKKLKMPDDPDESLYDHEARHHGIHTKSNPKFKPGVRYDHPEND